MSDRDLLPGSKSDSDESLRRQLEDAGPRPTVPPEHLLAIKEAARAVWRRELGAASDLARSAPRSRAVPALALAAALLLALAVGSWWLQARGRGSGALQQGVRVETVTGAPSWVAGEPPSRRQIARGDSLPWGARLETGDDDRLALQLGAGASVRLDNGTHLRLVHPGGAGTRSELRLERGAIYIDATGRATVAITSTFGLVTDLGTQFEVRLLAGAKGATELRLRVREGEIRLRTQRAVERASAGDELTVNHEGNVARRAIVATDEAWSWSLGIAPPFDINGETLGAYLDWLARETHWEIRFADPSLESLRGETLGSTGSIDLPPDRAFADVLRSASLRGDLEGNVLMIRSAR